MTVLYGIANCDTVRKARKWLEARGVEHRFHDFRRDGIDPAMVGVWVEALGWREVLNTRSPTWRGLPEAERDAMDAQKAIEAAQTAPTLVKRPVLEHDGTVHTGFSPERYAEIFGGA